MPAHISHRISLVLAALLLATAVPFAAPAVAVAEVAASGITSGNLQSVTFISATTGFVAAENGVILKTTDGGTTWTTVRSADASYSFRGIDFWNATKGVAVDYSGKVAETNDAGATWTNVDFGIGQDMDAASLYDVGSHNDVAIAGMRAITGAGDNTPGDGNWTPGIAMLSSGSAGYWPPMVPSPHTWYNSGSLEWVDVGSGEFLDVEYASGTNTWWVSGIDYWPIDAQNPQKFPLFKSTDGGVNWTEISFGTNDLRLEGVAFDAAGTAGIAVGQLVGGARRAYYTTDSGTTWLPATLSGTANLTAVDMTSATDGWAVSADGTIIRTTNGGATWTACTIVGGNAFPLRDVEFRPGTNTGWAVGDAGTVLLTTDGINWSAAGSGAANQAPVLASIGNKTIAEGAQLAFPASATDADVPAQTLTYSLAPGAPAGAAITSGGAFTWTPTEAQGPNSYSITVVVSDGTATDSETITATVTEVNQAPVLASIGNKTIAEGAQLAFPASATDADVPAQTLTYSLAPGAPAGAAITSGGAFTWTPTEAQGPNSYSITVVVSDGTATDSESLVVTVTGPGDPPPPPPVQLQAVYRFYNNSNGTHFFTPSADERAMVNAKWGNIYTDEGVAYSTNPANNTQPLYRFYNKNSGSHFYTASAAEADMILAKWPTIFSLDGQTYAVNPTPVPNSIPVYRFYNLKNGSHFYTASAEEADMVRARWPNVYSYEGPAFWLGQ